MALRKIAIIGSGYSAIGIAFHLRSLVGARISVFDECDVGTGGASAVSAGMLHPISPKGKMSWRGTVLFCNVVRRSGFNNGYNLQGRNHMESL